MDYLKVILNKSKWTSFAASILILSQFLIYLLIVYFVSPEDLGFFALANSIIIIPLGLIEFSFNSSLIHEENPQPKDFRSVLTLNVIAATVFLILSLLMGIILSAFYGETQLWLLVLCLSPSLFFCAFNSVHIAGLKKELRFDTLSKLEIISTLCGFTVGLYLILLHLGIWALVFSMVVRFGIMTFLIVWKKHLYCTFKLEQNKTVLIKHYDFGKFIIGEKGLSSLLSYFDVFLVGSFLGVGVLGIYDVIKKIVLRPILVLYTAVENVVFPLLSNAQNDHYKFKQAYGQFLYLTNIFFIPLLLVIYVFSDIFLKILPSTYEGEHHTLKAIAVLGIAIVIFNPTDILLYSRGKTKLFFQWLLAYTLPFLGLMFLTVQVNLNTFIYSMAAFYLLMFVIAYFVLFKKDPGININTYFKPLLLTLLSLVFLISIELNFATAAYQATGIVFIICLVLLIYYWEKKTKNLISDLH